MIRDYDQLQRETVPEILPQELPPAEKPAANINPDEIIFTRALANRCLREVFNFATLERISLVSKDENSPVEAITRERFATLEDDPALQQAFAEHQRRGGKVAESAVFPHRLPKARLS